MNLHFYKYHGTGNDFILLDNRAKNIVLNTAQIAHLCHRHFGIGADGLMLLELEEGYDFKMVYYNADGNESSMCGNGGRCITAFAHELNRIDHQAKFIAIDGPHNATIQEDGLIQLQMADVATIHFYEQHAILNTGSPHYVLWEENTDGIDVFQKGKSIRNQPEFMPQGINVNFVQCAEEGLYVRTYERGVEDETLSCGTGVTAAAIASTFQKTGSFSINIKTLGGGLKVVFQKVNATSAKDVFLIGPAIKIFEGTIAL